MKVGDLVQYRSAMGELMGYALVVEEKGYWIVIRDIHTHKLEHWCESLMVKVLR